MLFDCGHPSFGKVDSAIPIDVVGMKSYMDSLFDPTCVPVGVTISKLNLAKCHGQESCSTYLCKKICIKGFLSKKTRLLVSHQKEHFHGANKVICAVQR